MRIIIWCFFIFPAFYAVGQSTITIVLQPDSIQGKDAGVWSNGADNNLGNFESNTIYTWTNNGLLGNKRTFIEFDLSAIPENATIISAGLSLYYNPTDPYEGFDEHTGENDLLIQRVLSDWQESTITWNNQPPVSEINQVSLPPSTTGTQDYLDIDVTALVADMIDPGLEGNHGFMLKMADEENVFKSLIFASSDHANVSLHPKLEVIFESDAITCETFKLSPGEETLWEGGRFGNGNQTQDAVVWSNSPNTNLGNVESNTIYTWTNSGILGNKRSFIEFDLSAIPENTTIISAGLSLYYNPTDPYEGFDVHTGANDLLIQRVLSEWDESTITWNNQPAPSELNQVSLPPSSTETQDYLDIDVTGLVSDMIAADQEGNHGFMLRMADEENVFKGLIFASGDHDNSELHPKLNVCWMEESVSSLLDKKQPNLFFEIYPNPGSGRFQLKFPGGGQHKYKVEIFDVTGKRISEVLIKDRELYISEKGIFLIRIVGDQGNYGIKKVTVH